jgi:hypothetical protein
MRFVIAAEASGAARQTGSGQTAVIALAQPK